MKKFNLLILGILFIGGLIAQESIEWGKTNVAKSKTYYPDIIGENEKNIYTFSLVNKGYVVESHRKGSYLKNYSTSINPEKIKKNKTQLEDVIFFNNRFVVFVSYFDKKAKQSVIYAYYINGKTGKADKHKQKIFSIPVEKKSRDGSFSIMVSPDKSKVLIRHYAYYKKQKAFKEKIKVLDDNLEELNATEEISLKKGASFTLSNGVLDNDGSIYFLKKEKVGKKDDAYSIISYEARRDFEKWEENLSVKDLGLEIGAFINDIHFTINENNELIVSGYYALKKQLKGCFYLRIDNKSKEIEVKKINEFDDKFVDQFKTKKQEKKGKEAEIMNRFHNVEILTKKDGGIVLLGELYYYYYVSSDQGTSYKEYFGDIIVLDMSSEGDLNWGNRIPKKQVFAYRAQGPFIFATTGFSLFIVPNWRTVEYFSYLAAINDEKISIIFNDNPKNNLSTDDQTKLKALKKVKKATVTKYTIDLKTGEKKEELFANAKDFDVYIKPQVYYQKGQNEPITVFGMKGKKYKYGTFNLD
ncbi:MAG: hypothetical protein N4A35_07625 [Flavobacteriales bacterium]|jgi:hypothetical protein|nr:hypothetical protein [Flavobacteriales bacterium]